MPGPPLSREQVAATLRQLRERIDPRVSISAAAGHAGISQPTLTKFEQGRHLPTEAQMTGLLDLYRPDGFTRSQLLASCRERWGPKQQQVVMHGEAATAQRRIGEAEARAARVVTFSPLVVPGLLQAPGYLRAIGRTALDGDALESWIEQRLARQRRVHEPGAAEYVQYTTTAALAWALGGPDVMREQIRHLADATTWPTVTFGIVPAARPARRFALHGFDVLTDPAGGRLVHYGTHSGVVTVTEPGEQREMLDVLAEVERLAVSGDLARAELGRVAGLYR